MFRFYIAAFFVLFVQFFATQGAIAEDASRKESLRRDSEEYNHLRGYNLGSKEAMNLRFYHYSPFEYPIGHQLWDGLELDDGRVVVADQNGIHVLSAGSWKTIPSALGTTVRSLAVSPSGPNAKGQKIFYGAQGELGVLAYDSTGVLSAFPYNSLLPEGFNFGDVWATHWTSDGVVFQTSEYLIQVTEGKKAIVLPAEQSFHNSFKAGGRIYVRERGIGLKVLENGELISISGGEVFEDEMIFGVTESETGRVHVWARFSGIYVVNVEGELINLRSYAPQLKTKSSSNRLYAVEAIGGGEYAIATLGGGLLITNLETEILASVSDSDGLPDPFINFLVKSKEGGLWLGFNSQGLGYIDRGYPIERYGRAHGITGNIYSAGKIGDRIAVATSTGVFQSQGLLSGDESHVHFYSQTPIEEVFFQVSAFSLVWDFLEVDRWLFISTEAGVFVSPDGGEEWQQCTWSQETEESNSSYKAYALVEDEERKRVLVGLEKGLGTISLLDHTDGRCTIHQVSEWSGIPVVRDVIIDGDNYFFETRYEGAFLASIDDQGNDGVVKNISGVPSGIIDIEKVDGRVILVNKDSGVFEFVEDSDKPLFRELNSESVFAPGTTVFSIAEYLNDSSIIVFDDSVSFVFRSELLRDSRVKTPTSLKFDKTETSTIFVDSTGVVWFNNGSELIRYDPKYDVPGKRTFKAHIAGVKKSSDGEALFNGFFRAENGGIAGEQPEWSIPVLDYESRNLTFHFSATEFINPEAVQYRFRIDGKEAGIWSEWSDERETMTPSIEEGSFTIVVQAKDEIGRLSEEATYSFVILPPWYRTIWAYLAYLILGVSAVASGHKYVLMRRAHKNAAEQAKELEREREVVKRLSEANDRLTQANKLKDEFLATTSHELRTPLTAILGFTSVLKDEIPQEAEYREFLDIIEESGGRLMETLNSLLDLAKLRAGIMEVNPETIELYQHTFQEVVKHQDAAQKKGLRLKVRRPASPMHATADVYGLGRVLHNLVGNAIKFTDEGQVEVWFEEKAGRIEVHVSDTGIGIDSEFLPELFNAFIQESDGLARTHEGTGLGLAITSGLVQLMDAEIRVESEKGKGSDFVVSLPKASAPRRHARRVSGMGNTASA